MTIYDRAIKWFALWLSALRDQDCYADSLLSRECQSHNAYLASIGRLEHSPFGGEHENVAVIEPGHNPIGAIERFAQMWISSDEHRLNLLACSGCFGLAMYWARFRIYGTFRC